MTAVYKLIVILTKYNSNFRLKELTSEDLSMNGQADVISNKTNNKIGKLTNLYKDRFLAVFIRRFNKQHLI